MLFDKSYSNESKTHSVIVKKPIGTMNFGGLMGGNAHAGMPQQPSKQSQLMMAKVEMASYADLFERLSRVCFQKCKFKYTDGQLNVGEMSCIDRCAGKYMEAYSSLGVKMAQVEKEIMDQAGASAGVPQ